MNVDLILLSMPAHDSNMYAAGVLRESGFQGRVAAIARFPDEVQSLKEAGVHIAFNMYAEAGAGFCQPCPRQSRYYGVACGAAGAGNDPLGSGPIKGIPESVQV